MILFAWIINSTLAIGLVLFAACSLRLLWQNRHHLYMRKRRPDLIGWMIFFALLASTYNVIFDPELCLFNICNQYPKGPKQIHQVLYICLIVPRQVLMSSRIWFLFYDLRYTQSLLTHRWWNNITDQKDWFIRHKSTLGSFQFMSKYICISVILWFIFNVIGIYCFPALHTAIFAIMINSLWVLMIICFCKMPKMYDALHIRTEINITTMIYFAQAIYHTIVAAFHLKSKFVFITYCHHFVSFFVNILLIAFMILLPYHYYHQRKTKQTDESTIHKMMIESSSNLDKATEKTDCKSWQSYVNDCEADTKFNIFVRHLTKEFATENIYFTLEIMQYKKQLMNDNDIERCLSDGVCVTDVKVGLFVKLPDCLPMSSIVQQHSGSVTKQIERLYKKYIASDASMAVNMSYESRKAFMSHFNMMDKLDQQQTLLIFDAILFDVLRNLKSTFIRFKVNHDAHESYQKKDIISVIIANETN